MPLSGVHPGFPVGGDANSPEGGPTYDFAKFSKKLHEIEKFLGRGGGAGAPPWIRHCLLMETLQEIIPHRICGLN